MTPHDLASCALPNPVRPALEEGCGLGSGGSLQKYIWKIQQAGSSVDAKLYFLSSHPRSLKCTNAVWLVVIWRKLGSGSSSCRWKTRPLVKLDPPSQSSWYNRWQIYWKSNYFVICVFSINAFMLWAPYVQSQVCLWISQLESKTMFQRWELGVNHCPMSICCDHQGSPIVLWLDGRRPKTYLVS